MGTRIPFARPDGKTAEGYLSLAGKANAPGVVVIQEWWGLQDQIKGLCDRFALLGYDALAPDLYNGVVIPYHDADAANAEMNSLNFLDAADQNVRGAGQFLLRSSPKVAVSGFCMGGAVAVLAGCRVPEFSAVVSFYGLPPATVAKPADLKVPFQGHFANSDDFITPAMVDAFETGLKGAGKPGAFYRYDASHAFMNEQRSVHDRHCAELAWERTSEFLKTHLG
ncbi:dienelactone hydrolase family protein [Hyphomicrobium facile]|uniref:Carboxymethylenebutenolidase n=1 Tax=Hyphomicrobium facile TaxID=51670 RepID=A0A1I7MV61_9HYPH|nr:dienelactone hydrolase family protein [Hyphomicrobium facile]SFV26293.1 carboxymethylenebutenolidase [Hyphomicrobium facile]